jgi:glycerol-3-phosphate acyltransferase PlsX
MPTLRGPCVLIDVGANVNPKPEHLLHYGVMGAIYARHILGKSEPTIGLLNVGSEEEKGHGLAKETHTLFNASPFRDCFVGNIEGRDLHRGAADVVVCDGFVGNIVLKLSEGVFEFIMNLVGQELLGVLDSERDKAKRALAGFISRYDYSAFGGAPLLGIDGICVICHGSSGDQAIKNALGMAAKEARVRMNELIVRDLQNLPRPVQEPEGPAPAVEQQEPVR